MTYFRVEELDARHPGNTDGPGSHMGADHRTDLGKDAFERVELFV